MNRLVWTVRSVVVVLGAVVLGVVGVGCAAEGSGAEASGVRWYKGNLHTHSLWSDGDDFPEHIALWYREHGYDFLAISDHNSVQQGEKWVKYKDLYLKGAGPATERYLKEFARRDQVRGDRAAGTQEIRLSPFAEYRPKIEKAGKFLLIPSEEISDKFEKKPIHMNATNIVELIKPRGGSSVTEAIANNLRAVKEQGQRLNRPVLPHLNHPNFEWGVTAEELAEVVEEHFFEVFNGHPKVNVEGDKDHPSSERIWDIVNTLRLTTYRARPLMGLGTDDTHHYHTAGMSRSMPGRGWICVRARALSAEAIIAAMEAGDFYASTGVVLKDVKFDAATGTIDIEIEPRGEARFVTKFIGTLAENPGEVGVVLATVQGARASYRLTGKELYVRATVTSDQRPVSPVWEEQKMQAWTQPVGWKRPVRP